MPCSCRGPAPAAAERGPRQSERGVLLELVPQRLTVCSTAAAERGSPQSEAPCARWPPWNLRRRVAVKGGLLSTALSRVDSHPALTEGLTVFRCELPLCTREVAGLQRASVVGIGMSDCPQRYSFMWQQGSSENGELA